MLSCVVRRFVLILNAVYDVEVEAAGFNKYRGDFFNVINRTNFNEPNGTLGTPNFGRITSARLPRTIQLPRK